MADYRELLIGCGNQRKKLISLPEHKDWADLTTLDNDPNCGADIDFDLLRLGQGWELPFDHDSFDELHAYHVLEHLSQQGDYKGFFREFSEFYRILKPNGLLCGVVPSLSSPWAWADPGHTRLMPPEFAVFLDQAEYVAQVGKTALADYRHLWDGDFEKVWEMRDEPSGQYRFVLKAIKPAKKDLELRVEIKNDELDKGLRS